MKYSAVSIFGIVLVSWSKTTLGYFPSYGWRQATKTPVIGRENWGVDCRLSSNDEAADQRNNRRKLVLQSSGDGVYLHSRTLTIASDWAITVWEWEQTADVVESYWEEQASIDETGHGKDQRVLDPFGLVTWPGSVVAAQALRSHVSLVKDHRVLILGAGVGVEAQAAAELGAKQVLATDIHPTTLQQLEVGVASNDRIPDKSVVQTQIFDLTGKEALPMALADMIVVADVLYNEDLARHVVRRVVEGWQRNPKVKILVTDSQRFVKVMTLLQEQFSKVSGDTTSPDIEFVEETLVDFTGSGVCIDGDQTYDVKVRTLWIGVE